MVSAKNPYFKESLKKKKRKIFHLKFLLARNI